MKKMYKNILTLLILVLFTSCGNKKETFSNDLLIGEYSSTKNGTVEFVIKKDETGYYFQQSIKNGTDWAPRENLTEMTEKELEENLGRNWKEYTYAGLTSGICSYFKGSKTKITKGITAGDQPNTVYFSRCFSDNYFYKIK